jgi:hypothetical protein
VGKDNGFNPWSVPRAAFSFSSVQAPAGRMNAVQPPLKGLRDEETGVVRRSPSSELHYAGVLFCEHQPYDRRLRGHHPPPLRVLVVEGCVTNGGETRRKSFGANALRLRPQCQIQTYMMPMAQFSWGIPVKASSVASGPWGDLLATA